MELSLLVKDFAAKQMKQVLIAVFDPLLHNLQPFKTLVEIIELIVVFSQTDIDLFSKERTIDLLNLQQQGL
jgi:hypothetical protein